MHTVYLSDKHILSFSRPVFCRILTWQNLEGLAELANLTIFQCFEYAFANTDFFLSKHCASPACQLDFLWLKQHNNTDTGTLVWQLTMCLEWQPRLIKTKVKVNFSLEKVWKWECFNCDFCSKAMELLCKFKTFFLKFQLYWI